MGSIIMDTDTDTDTDTIMSMETEIAVVVVVVVMATRMESANQPIAGDRVRMRTRSNRSRDGRMAGAEAGAAVVGLPLLVRDM